MRVLHVVPSVAPLRGGSTTAVQAMARGLSRAGLQVHVATTDDNGVGRLKRSFGVPLTADTVTYWYFPRQTRFYGVSLPLAQWLRRHVIDYDVVHIHSLFSWTAMVAAGLSAWRGIPYVIGPLGSLSRWGIVNRRPLLKRLSLRVVERRILGRAARIHYTSQRERVEAESFGFSERGAVIPLGVDLSELEQSAEPGWLQRRAPSLSGRTVMLFLSRIDVVKGLHLLLRAVHSLRADGQTVALVVAGSGPPQLESKLREEAALLGLRDDILWAGFLESREKVAALAEADVFVLPSYSENFGVAAVEAMACGVPLVISDQVAISGEVIAAGAGLVVPCETQALAAAMTRLVQDPNLRRKAGECGRRLARERFSLEAMTAGLKGMYEEVLDERRPSQARPGVVGQQKATRRT